MTKAEVNALIRELYEMERAPGYRRVVEITDTLRAARIMLRDLGEAVWGKED